MYLSVCNVEYLLYLRFVTRLYYSLFVQLLQLLVGCLPFSVKNRRHAWDFPSKPEGFKLGGLLLDRGKRGGFEMLDQNASDEENDVSANMLTSAPFA